MTSRASAPVNAPRAQAARHLRALDRALQAHRLTWRAVAVLMAAWLVVLAVVRLPEALYAATGDLALVVAAYVFPALLTVALALTVEHATWQRFAHLVDFRRRLAPAADARRHRDALRAFLRETSPRDPPHDAAPAGPAP